MADEHEFAESLAFIKEPWFLITAGLLAAAVIGLTVAYYLRHPERDLWNDFRDRGISNLATTNGHVPDPQTRPGVDVVQGADPYAEG